MTTAPEDFFLSSPNDGHCLSVRPGRGIGDGACANLGTGAVTPDRIALSLGTSGAIRYLLIEHAPGTARDPARLRAYRLDHAHVLLGAAISNGGKVLAWLLDLIGADFDGPEVARAVEMEPDRHMNSPEYV